MATIKISKPEEITVEFEEVPGKVFKIGTVTQDLLDKIQAKEEAIDQASVLLGCKPSVLKAVDMRSLNSFLASFLEELTGGNPPQADGEN